SDIAIGTAVAGRGEKALDDVVGMFVNTLVLRNVVHGRNTLVEVIDGARETAREAFAHADVPFERLVEVLDPPRSTSHTPLFQVMLTLQNVEATEFALPGLDLAAMEFDSTTAQFDLALTLAPSRESEDGAVSGTFVYSSELFDVSTISSMAERFVRVLRAMVETPTATVRALDLRNAQEMAALELWNDTTGPAASGSVVDAFTAQVLATPDAPAVTFEDRTWSYSEFAGRVNRLARELISSGVGPDAAVAVVGTRSHAMLESIYAVLAAGGVYVPIDPDWPTNRIQYVLDVADPVLVLSSTSAPRIEVGRRVVDVDTLDLTGYEDTEAVESVESVPIAPVRPDNVAYTIFTSGSTGRPKGVSVSHRAVVNQLEWLADEFGVVPEDTVLQKTSIGFDASVWEVLLPLSVGARIVLAEPEGHRDPQYMTDVIASEAITIAQFVPSVLALMIDIAEPGRLDTLRAVLVGGEQLSSSVASDFRALSGADVHNVYGPTETTVQVTHCTSSPDDLAVVPIGRPVRNVRLHVLDSGLTEVPISVAGELYVAGDQLARGYASRPALTAERFVASPFVAGERLYRTGDTVRRRPDGSLVFLGRGDSQVKLNGLRIELGDIEAALRANETVAAAAAAVFGNVLVGYVVLAPGVSLDEASVLATSSARLPGYMVPSSVVALEALPLNSSGKLDRGALPAPNVGATATYRAPVSDVERTLTELFEQILGVDKVGLDDSFFALGGDSIMSIQLVSRAKSRGLLFRPRDVFESRTIARLAETAVWSTPEDEAVLREIDGGGVGVMPTTPIVEAMLERGSDHSRFTQSTALELPAGIDRAGIVATISAVVDHHDMLRARLLPGSIEWGVEVGPQGSVDVDALVRRVEFDAESDDDAVATAGSRGMDEALGALAPEEGVVMQFVWLDFGPKRKGRILVIAHHLVIDGVSWRILIPDFVTAWAQYSSGTPITLAPVGTSMRTWAHALQAEASSEERAAEMEHWARVLDVPDPPLGTRPFDPSRDRRSTMKSLSVSLPADITDGILTRVPRVIRGGVNDALLTALAMAVTKWRQQRDVEATTTLILLEGHGREEDVVPGADLSRTVGWFTAAFPVALDLSGIDIDDAFESGPNVGTALKHIKEQLIAVPDKGIGYGLLRYLR
ncbi:MAG: amino acid adenylation domain-containing protein, partial [Rhodococcus sp. (in: high G+C Gram-positive bacteria)]